MELNIPAIHGVGASRIYFVDRYREFSIYSVDFVPIPGADRTLRGLALLDAGQVWGQVPRLDSNGNIVLVNGTPAFENEKLDLNLRYSIGLGIAWISPLGPLKLSYAYPLNEKPTDRLQRFQFQIGTGF